MSIENWQLTASRFYVLRCNWRQFSICRLHAKMRKWHLCRGSEAD
ncbi:unnamed protein product [Prunus brigantina]